MKRLGTTCLLLLSIILIMTTACNSNDAETTPQQPAGGDTNATITAKGNVEALSHERLTFGSGGRIDKIHVKVGDKVNKGDVLAKLDTGDLELAEAQARVALAQATLTQTQSEIALLQTQATNAQLEANQIQAQEMFDDAEDFLEDAEDFLDQVRDALAEDSERVKRAKAQVEKAESQVEAARLQVEATRLQVEAAKKSVESAQQNVDLAQQNVDLAQQSLVLASTDLREATITAPFDGIISKIGMKEGEFLSPAVYATTTIVELIDPRQMNLTVIVNELDIVNVKTGQMVIINVAAIPETELEGRVTFISPVARGPVGVLLFEDEDEEKNYEVKIDFDLTANSPIKAGMSATAEIIVE